MLAQEKREDRKNVETGEEAGSAFAAIFKRKESMKRGPDSARGLAGGGADRR